MTPWGLMYHLSLIIKDFFHWVLLLNGHETIGCAIVLMVIYFEVYGIVKTVQKVVGR